MNAIICAAGFGARIQDSCKKHGVLSKCLLPVGGSTLLGLIIRELRQVGVTRIVVVANDLNMEEIKRFFTEQYIPEEPLGVRISVINQDSGFRGTTAAVLSGMKVCDGPFLLIWSDMIFRFPHRFNTMYLPHNIVFTTSVSQCQSARFDGIVCSGNRVMAFSPRAIEKTGPFLINTGVYFVKDLDQMLRSIERVRKIYLTSVDTELPIELVFQDMLIQGTIFNADSLDFFIDMGTTENYVAALNSLFGGDQ